MNNVEITPHPLEFSGSGGEFFRVWLVNLALTILTLGLYTPFARRRKAQYFYSHTIVADSPLEFTATKRKMFFGFLLLMALYAAKSIAEETGQDTAVALLMVGGVACAPYFWCNAMRFRLGATRWRGVRLQFTAGVGEVYLASWPLFVAGLAWAGQAMLTSVLATELMQGEPGDFEAWTSFLPFVVASVAAALLITVLLFPRLEFNYKRLLVAKARIGGQLGRWKPVYRDFVYIWLGTAGVFIVSVVVVLAVVALVALGLGIAFASSGPTNKPAGLQAFLLGVVMFVTFIFALFLVSAPARAYREARMFRLVWSNVGVSQIARFKSNLQTSRYVWLRVKNTVLALLTLGLYRPFALVSEYRMKTESVTLHVKGGVDQLAGQLVKEEHGLGDAIGDAIGLGLVG